jgi:phosphopantothenoylcysteine synthetase/decarboxylase
VCLFFRDGTQEHLPVMSKDAVADLLLDKIRQRMTGPAEADV